MKKPKKESQIAKLFRNKNQQKMAKTDKYLNQAYRPETEVKLTGEQFSIVRRAIQELRENRLIMVQVLVEGKVARGQGLNQNDIDIEQLLAYVDQIHKANVDAGITVSIDTLKEELAQQKEEQPKEEPPVSEQEATPEKTEVSDTPKEEDIAKKVKFKEEAETNNRE